MKIAICGSELVAWSPEFELMLKQTTSPVLIDGRNFFSCKLVETLGSTYYGIGK